MGISLEQVMDGWVDGWARSRGTPRPVRVAGGWFLDSWAPGEHGRIVLTRPRPERLREVVEADQPEHRLVKFAGDPDRWLPRFPAGWVPEDPGWFMTTQLEPREVGRLPGGYEMGVEESPHRVLLRITDPEGQPAARGQLGLGATYAVPDRIVTETGHQRLGLGSIVMAELGRRALQAGTGRAVLGATPDGRALYERLGWRVVSPMAGAYRRASG